MTHIYRYFIDEHLVDIFYDPNSDEVISRINVYAIENDVIGPLKKTHDVSDMSYGLYVQTLLILDSLNLF